MALQITDVFSLLTALVSKIMELAMVYTPRIVLSIALYVMGKLIIQWISYSAKKILSKRDLDPSLQSFLNSLVKISLHLMLIITVLGMMGINLTSFAAILAGLAVGIGAALNGTLGNFAGGVMMLLFKPFKLGDFIEAQGYSGNVIEQGIFNTYLLSPEHKTIILANGALSTGTIINHTRHGNIKVEFFIGVASDQNYDKVKSIILHTVTQHSKVLKTPGAEVNIYKIEDNNMILSVQFFTTQEISGDVYFELQEALKKAMDENQIENTTKSKR